MIEIKINNASLNAVLRDINKYPAKVQKVCADEIKKSGFNIERETKRNLKINRSVVTARLIGSIHVKLSNNYNFSYSDNRGQKFDGGLSNPIHGISVIIGTNVEYAPDVEKGHPARTVQVPSHVRITKEGKRVQVRAYTMRQPARSGKPYMKPAADREFPQLLTRLKRAL